MTCGRDKRVQAVGQREFMVAGEKAVRQHKQGGFFDWPTSYCLPTKSFIPRNY